MFKNYLTTSVRNLRKHKVHAFINIFGLSLGLACCILIFFFVKDELTYNDFHANIDTIYKVEGAMGEYGFNVLPGPFADVLDAEMPEVVRAVRMKTNESVVRRAESMYKERLLFVDAAFLEMFTFPFERGVESKALQTPNTVVLTAEMAEKYFGKEDPIGKTLSIAMGQQFEDFEVAGVTAPLPRNSSIEFDFLLPIEKITLLYRKDALTNWGSFAFNTLIQISDAQQLEVLNDKLPDFATRHMEAVFGEEAANFSIVLDPFINYHLGGISSGGPGLKAPGNPQHTYILGGIALLILLIASFNFMNLSIGQASTRLTEIGMRKALGAQRGQLMNQFWAEALLATSIALLGGIALAELFLPTFNELAEKQISMDYTTNAFSFLALIGITVIVGLLAGSYPAIIQSGFQPISIFRGKLKIGSNTLFTKSLVVTQFFLSIGLITCTLIINQQQEFLKTTNLGFDKEHVVVIPMQTTRSTREQGEVWATTLKSELQQHANILNVTMASSSFIEGGSASFVEKDEKQIIVTDFRVDPDYLETLGMQLTSGRDFSADLPTDATEAIIVNEAFVREFGTEEIPDDATWLENPSVIGVVRDFNYQSLRSDVSPAVLRMAPGGPGIGYVMARIAPDDIPGTLAVMQEAWARIQPDKPFQYSFLDAEMDQMYKAEERWSVILSQASFLAILIACLGLFGLTALTASRRTKEIGVRKVLGASVPGIVGLLSRDFLKLLLVANVLAWPVVYWVMEEWLQNFAFRVDIGVGVFVMAGLLALGIALLTISYQSIKAALADPVKALRYE